MFESCDPGRNSMQIKLARFPSQTCSIGRKGRFLRFQNHCQKRILTRQVVQESVKFHHSGCLILLLLAFRIHLLPWKREEGLCSLPAKLTSEKVPLLGCAWAAVKAPPPREVTAESWPLTFLVHYWGKKGVSPYPKLPLKLRAHRRGT